MADPSDWSRCLAGNSPQPEAAVGRCTMNRWYQVRRLRGAVILILIGVLALLNQWNIMHWRVSWPLIYYRLRRFVVGGTGRMDSGCPRPARSARICCQRRGIQSNSAAGRRPIGFLAACFRVIQRWIWPICSIAAAHAGRSRQRRSIAPWVCLHKHRHNIHHFRARR